MSTLKEWGHHPGESAKHTAENVKKSAASDDEPMEREHPEAPFALVGLAYLAALAVIGLIIGLVLFALS